MAFFKVNTSNDKIRDAGDGSYIRTSGIYEFVINKLFVTESSTGSQGVSLFINYDGQDQTLYNAFRLTNADGTENFGTNQMNKLCVIAGLKDGEEIPDPVPAMLPIGKGGAEKEVMVVEYFDNLPVKARVQFSYHMYEGKVQEQKSIRNFFRVEDNATASEIINGTDLGKQYEQELEYADKVQYLDGLTKEDVEQALKDRRAGKEPTTKPSAAVAGPRRFSRAK